MRLSNLVRFVEDKSLVAARGIGAATSALSHDIKAEYARRKEQRIVEHVEIMARAQVLAAERIAAMQREAALQLLDAMEARDTKPVKKGARRHG